MAAFPRDTAVPHRIDIWCGMERARDTRFDIAAVPVPALVRPSNLAIPRYWNVELDRESERRSHVETGRLGEPFGVSDDLVGGKCSVDRFVERTHLRLCPPSVSRHGVVEVGIRGGVVEAGAAKDEGTIPGIDG